LLLNADRQPMDYTLADNETGEYSFNYLPQGKYFIHPEKAGFETIEEEIHITERISTKRDVNFVIFDDTISSALTFSKKHDQHQLVVYPNPAVSELNVQMSAQENSDYSTIILYDVQGRIVKKKKYEGDSTKLLLENVPSGLLFLKVVDSNGQIISFKRIIKK